MKKYQLILHIALKKELIVKALKIAFVVGIILNLINQGEHLLRLDIHNIHFTKLIFTFCVPFCVSMYTAITMKMKFKQDEIALVDANLRCKNCNKRIFIKENSKIPKCDICGNKTLWISIK